MEKFNHADANYMVGAGAATYIETICGNQNDFNIFFDLSDDFIEMKLLQNTEIPLPYCQLTADLIQLLQEIEL